MQQRQRRSSATTPTASPTPEPQAAAPARGELPTAAPGKTETPVLDAVATESQEPTREQMLACARKDHDNPEALRRRQLEQARRFGPERERELQLAAARAYGPEREREVQLLMARANGPEERTDEERAELAAEAERLHAAYSDEERRALGALVIFDRDRREAGYNLENPVEPGVVERVQRDRAERLGLPYLDG